MGSTIVTDIRVAVVNDIKTPSGYCYVLYEQSYEKNVYPHKRRWNVRFIGDKSNLIKTIIYFTSFYEGGCVQFNKRDLNACTALKLYKDAFDHLVTLDLNHLIINFGSGSPFSGTIPSKHKDKMVNYFSAFGVECEPGNTWYLSLENTNVLSALMTLCSDLEIPPYQLFTKSSPTSKGFYPEESNQEQNVKDPDFYHFYDWNDRFVLFVNGNFEIVDSDYSLVEWYALKISNIPGINLESAIQLMGKFREKFVNPTPLPSDTKIRLKPAIQSEHQWCWEQVKDELKMTQEEPIDVYFKDIRTAYYVAIYQNKEVTLPFTIELPAQSSLF